MKRALLITLKGSVSLALLVYLFTRIDVEGLLGVLRSTRPAYVLVVLVLYLASQIVSSFRWALLARPVGFDRPFKEFIVYYLIGMFFNLFAPSTVGGDVGRVYYLASSSPQSQTWITRTATALSTVVADRAVGMAVLIWIAACALILFPGYALPPPVRYVTFGLALGLLLGWLLLPLFYRFFQRLLQPLGEGLRVAIQTYLSKRQVVLKTMVLSLVIHFGQAALHVVLGWSLDLEIPWSYAFILYPLVGAFAAIPISFNGIGLREGGYLFMLQRIEISPEKALAFSLLWFTVVVLDSLVGGVVFVFRRRREGVVEVGGLR
ncbi:MAG TPA: lysylphosphatidylglycerol synthase transmembrane domain-containing protein [Candidatus Binatia bacterium]